MFSVIPPTGVPISWELLFPRRKAGFAEFSKKLTELLGGEVFLTNCGKSSLYIVLKAARSIYPEKTEVIVPDYTCWSVPSAVVRAGLKVKPADISADDLGLSIDSLSKSISENTLAIIACHLFGFPNKIDEIEQLCKTESLLLIDDAAQGLGAYLGDRPLGSFGDAGILSFGRGKNITTLHGGAAIIRNERLAEAATRVYSDEFKRNKASNKNVLASGQENKASLLRTSSVIHTLQLLAYKLMFNRRLYWFPDMLPFMHIGKTEFDPDFEMGRMPQDLALRGVIALEKLDEITEKRKKIARKYQDRLDGVEGLLLLHPTKEAKYGYLRFPAVLTDEKNRRYILNEGHKLGISGMYPGTVSSIPELQPSLADDLRECPVSRRIASKLVTLPTHFGVKDSDIKKIADLVRENLKSQLKKNTTIKKEAEWRKSITSKNI